MILRATRHQAPDEASALELFHLREWTDGLPVVIPTEERVEALLSRRATRAGRDCRRDRAGSGDGGEDRDQLQ